jgi:hypothetical protein
MKPLVDQYIRLDVRLWQGLGLLTPGRRQPVVWRNAAGAVVLTLLRDVSREELTLRSSPGDGPTWPWYEEVIEIERRYFGHQGHRRPWWRCPYCDRLVALLYGVDGGFRCRRCAGLAYPSQYQPRALTRLQRAQRLRQRVSDTPGPPGSPTVPRHPGRLTAGLYRTVFAIERLEGMALQELAAKASRQWAARGDVRGLLAMIDVRRQR